jgi:membrane fusion protein (multidrug efflux system)
VEEEALTVPVQAIQRDTAGHAQLYVVKADDTVELRPVQVGRSTGQRAVIAQGLKAGDHVVVEGFQKIRPGAAVKPQSWKPGGAATAAENTASAG